jgi:WD40 repeat protein
MEGHDFLVLDLTVLPGRRRVVSASGDTTLRLWDLDTGKELRRFVGHRDWVRSVTTRAEGREVISVGDDRRLRIWNVRSGKLLTEILGDLTGCVVATLPDERYVLLGSEDTIQLWDLHTGAQLRRLEGHTNWVRSLSVLPGGKQVLSSSDDRSLRLWSLDSGAEIGRYLGHQGWVKTAIILPDGRRAVSGSEDGTIRVWDLELLNIAVSDSVGYTTARIALLGDSGVGKTGLGWRIAHGEFREHSSTHGQQFWVVDQLGGTRSDGALCEGVLWDLAGQPDYRLIHALFLDKVDFGLLLFDPANRERPLAGVEYWLRHLRFPKPQETTSVTDPAPEKQALALLVAARSDRGSPTLSKDDLEEFCRRNGISGYAVTSAKSDYGIADLVAEIKSLIPWDRLTATTTTKTFKRIKEHILKLKESSTTAKILLDPIELKQQLSATDPTWRFEDDEMMTAVGHLANHGYVTRIDRANGKQAILLAPDLLINLAASIVLEARRHERGLGLVDETRLLANGYPFPELGSLSETELTVLLDAATSLFLQRNLCFREIINDTTCLVFPSLINERRPPRTDLNLNEDVSYYVVGAVETVYPALVVQLGYTNLFRRDHHWQNQAQYELGPGELCCFRQVAEREGEIELVLSYSEAVGEDVKSLFQGAFERFLKRRNAKIVRFPTALCSSGHLQERTSVWKAINFRRDFFFCDVCGDKVQTPAADDIGVSERDDTALRKAEEIVLRRTDYEVAVAWVKAFRRDRGDGVARPSCFISYAWGDQSHERWVEELADDLQKADVAVILDKWHNPPGTSVSRFIERIENSTFVCAVGTPNYKEKDLTRDYDPVVQAEMRLIKSRLMKRDEQHQTVIPLLRFDVATRSFPPLFEDSVYVDFRTDSLYLARLFELVLVVHRIPFETEMARKHRAAIIGEGIK